MKNPLRYLAACAALASSFGLFTQTFAATVQGISLYANSVQYWDTDMWGTAAGVVTPGLRPTAADTVNFPNSSTLSYQRTRVRLRTNESVANIILTAKTLQLNLDQGYTFTTSENIVFGSHASNSATGSILINNNSTLYVGGNVTLARSNSSMGWLSVSSGVATIGGTLALTGGNSTQGTLSITGGSVYVGSLTGNTAATNVIGWTAGTFSVQTASAMGFTNAGTGTLRLAGDNATGGVFFYNTSNFYTQSASGTTVIEIKGTGQSIDTGTQTFTGDYDYAYFNGTSSAVVLDGTIYLDIINGYALQVGDTFNLVYAKSITVEDTITLAASAGVDVSKFSYDIIADAETGGQILQVSYIPEPATAALLSAAAALALVARRRRAR